MDRSIIATSRRPENGHLLRASLKPAEHGILRLPWEECLMKTRAAVAVGAGKPLEIMEVDLEGP
ncbi:hypothetical protein, partial [Mesorhizobium sp.]|uniref:hypothetical protein n=1 Tax=Mesorhizobium sp. TaxID=1871066 RepID=UPI000FE9C92E